MDAYPHRYARLTLRQLCRDMHEHLTEADPIDALDRPSVSFPSPSRLRSTATSG